MDGQINHQTLNLINGVKTGDKAAMEQLYSTYSDRILRIVRLRMGNELRSKMQSMDIVQDALLGGFRDLESFTYRNEGDFLRWMSKIVENKIRDNIDKLHAQKRDIRREIPLNNNRQSEDDGPGRIFGPIDSTTPSIIMSRNEELDRLEKAMKKLKQEYQQVIIMTKMEGLSQKHVAEKLGKSPDAVRMLLSRALAALGAAFEELDGTAS